MELMVAAVAGVNILQREPSRSRKIYVVYIHVVSTESLCCRPLPMAPLSLLNPVPSPLSRDGGDDDSLVRLS